MQAKAGGRRNNDDSGDDDSHDDSDAAEHAAPSDPFFKPEADPFSDAFFQVYTLLACVHCQTDCAPIASSLHLHYACHMVKHAGPHFASVAASSNKGGMGLHPPCHIPLVPSAYDSQPELCSYEPLSVFHSSHAASSS